VGRGTVGVGLVGGGVDELTGGGATGWGGGGGCTRAGASAARTESAGASGPGGTGNRVTGSTAAGTGTVGRTAAPGTVGRTAAPGTGGTGGRAVGEVRSGDGADASTPTIGAPGAPTDSGRTAAVGNPRSGGEVVVTPWAAAPPASTATSPAHEAPLVAATTRRLRRAGCRRPEGREVVGRGTRSPSAEGGHHLERPDRRAHRSSRRPVRACATRRRSSPPSGSRP
jgi:hypothetical protein